ncbi:MAG: hypothetical protein E7470_00020 [Ruminococcaceae bacterium]|nr:hypothetical protein [Oscillospiraceae bacterium]
MKKLISLLIVMAVCAVIVLPVAAADFVPSISYKDHPDLVGDPEITTPTAKELDLLITPVADALDTPPADRNEMEQELVDVYEALTDGDMKLPYPDDKNYVIRDLLDVSVIEKNDDPNADPVFYDGEVDLKLTFDLGVKPDVPVLVYIYDGEWKRIDNVINNGDGTITIELENTGVLAFCMESDLIVPPTFDKMNDELTLWITLMVVSSCAVVAMLALRRKLRD